VDVEERLDYLDRVHTFVFRRDEHEFPGGAATTRYRFVHVLYQNALYDSLTGARRAELSRKVAESLLSFYAKSPGPVAAELGYLFEQARDAGKAAEFYTLAARNAARVFANGEAAQLAGRGLAALAKSERTPADAPLELTLQLIYGSSLSATQGYAYPDVRTAMARAREIAEELGDRPQLAPVIWGLFAHHLVAGEVREAQRWAEHLLRLGTAANDPMMLVGAHGAMSFALFYFGRLPEVLEHCEKAAALYDRDKRPTYHAMYRMDPGVFIFSESARTSCLVGFPDSALKARDNALKLGSDSPDPRSAAFAFLFGAVLHELRREGDQALHFANLCIGVSDEHGIGQERAWAMTIRGWSIAASGRVDEGVSEIEAAIAVQRSSHAELNLTFGLRQLAETYMWQGSLDKAQAAIEEALSLAAPREERASLHELHRIYGETLRALRRMRGGNAAADGDELFARAESEFRLAIEEARRQSAMLLELRAAAGLGRLLEEKGRGEEMRAEVTRLRNAMTEGLELEDVRLANEFLDRITPRTPSPSKPTATIRT
jgi:tetratricopeptide (TPR) repeat protein